MSHRFPRLLALSLCWLIAPIAAAESSHGNYGLLRSRLLDEFVVLGTAQGQGQPMVERSDQTGVVRWADSTIQLGFYLGVLATEYALLSDPDGFPEMSRGGGDLDDTLQELSVALSALERLDAVADASFDSPCTQAQVVNGFFIRDDVPADAWQAYSGASQVSSDYTDSTVTNKEMSQDQVYHLLAGLALVRRFVPDDASDVQPSSWATELALGIIGHVAAREDWTIVNPACDDRDVARGADAGGYAVATSMVSGWFSDGQIVPDYPEYSEPLAEAGRDPDSILYSNVDNLHMAMAVSATGDAWGESTTEDLILLAGNEGWVLYPLLHQALHGPTQAWCDQGEAVLQQAYSMLEELPIGDEPRSPWPDTAAHSFTSWNRFIRGANQAYTGPDDSQELRYAGLDFMLLHNLLVLTTPGAWDGELTPECPADPHDSGQGSASQDPGCACGVAPRGRGLAWLSLALGLFLIRRRAGEGRPASW